MKPELSVSSNGHKNQYGHPRWPVIRELEDTAKSIAAPHFLRGYHTRTRFADKKQYDFDIFTTSSNGNIVVRGRRDGSYTFTLFDK